MSGGAGQRCLTCVTAKGQGEIQFQAWGHRFTTLTLLEAASTGTRFTATFKQNKLNTPLGYIQVSKLLPSSFQTTMAAAPPRRSSWLLPKRDVSDTVDDVKTVTGSHLPELHSSSNSNRWSALPFLNKSASSLHTDTFMNALERTTSKNALERTTSKSTDKEKESRPSGSFGKMSFSSMMGGLSSLSLSRTPTNDKDEARGRSSSTIIRSRSSSSAPNSEPPSRSQSRARSQSPFSLRRFRTRETSPAPPQPLPLNQSDTELPTTAENSPRIRPRTAFLEDHGDDSGDETANEDHYSYNGETEDEEWSDDDLFDPVTERNTERNALTEPALPIGVADGEEVDPDPLGEGVNVVVPPEPYFPTTLNTYSSSASVGSSGSMRSRRNPRRRKSTKVVEPMPLTTSRPVFQRDRCTITLTQGNPPPHEDDRRRKRYVVASDLSDESRYALEWAIGTVLRDGDELLIVSVVENESKGITHFSLHFPALLIFYLVDPANANAIDRATKLRSQQEVATSL